jgi:hypothetical protein
MDDAPQVTLSGLIKRRHRGDELPQADRAVFAGRGQDPAVSGKRASPDRLGVGVDGHDQGTICSPETHRAIPAGTEESTAVRGESHLKHLVLVSLQLMHPVAAESVEDTNSLVVGGRGDPPAVGREGHVPDHRLVSGDHQRFPGNSRLPDSDRSVPPGSGHPFAVRRKSHAMHRALMPAQVTCWFKSGKTPEPDDSIGTARGQVRTRG